jgi:hypothetical protein
MTRTSGSLSSKAAAAEGDAKSRSEAAAPAGASRQGRAWSKLSTLVASAASMPGSGRWPAVASAREPAGRLNSTRSV